MGAAIVLGFGFCIGVVLFLIVCRLAGVAFMRWASKPPPTDRQIAARQRRKQIGEWIHMGFGLAGLFGAVLIWSLMITGVIH